MQRENNINKRKSIGQSSPKKSGGQPTFPRRERQHRRVAAAQSTQTPEQTFTVTIFKGASKPANGKEHSVSWREFVEELRKPVVRREKDGEMFSPASYTDKYRHAESATELSMLALDIDGKLDLSLAKNVCAAQPFSPMIHTSHSHQRVTEKHPKAEDCYRIIIPLKEPIPAEDYPDLWKWGNDYLFYETTDPQTKDLSRGFYLPAIYSKDSPYECVSYSKGEFLDWRLAVEWMKEMEESEAEREEVEREENAGGSKSDGLSVWDDYNRRGDGEPFILKLGADPVKDCSDGRQWHHPDSEHPGSVVEFTAPDGVKVIYFRTHRFGSKFPQGASFNNSQLRALVEYGDLSKATWRKLAKELRAEGYGDETKNNGGKARDSAIEILDGKYRLEVEFADRGKLKLTARDTGGAVIHRDVINLDKADDREGFIRALALDSESERKAVRQVLMMVADNPPTPRESAPQVAEERVMSKVLSDGRIIEQIANGKFAVYDPQTDTFGYADEIDDAEVIYKPSTATYGMSLPDKLTEYGTEAELDRRIEEIYRRYCDAPDNAIKAACKYARMTYVVDLLNVLPYLKAVGEPGSGKSRFCKIGTLMSYHPIIVVDITKAVLFRLVDECSPTLFLDEFNPQTGGEDTEGIIQVLNAGFQRGANVFRTGEPDAEGKRNPEPYSPFGAKFLAGLKSSGSAPFESRCIEVKLQKTTRKDIRFRDTPKMNQECAEVASMLYLWRLRFLSKSRDAFETKLDAAEDDLKKYEVDPRYIQIATPLYALIEDEALKKDFVESLEKRTQATRGDKLDSFDGKLVRTVYEIVYDDSDGKVRQKRPYEVDEPIYDATIVDIKNALIGEYPDLKDGYIGKKLGELGFSKAPLTKYSYNGKKNDKKNRSAVVFDPETLTKIFVNYGLPLPGEAVLTQPELVKIEDQVSYWRDEHPEPERRKKRL
jgi:hypothetical protein